ncbi:MAG: nicotinate (nicotinamide) nucleotide adenylyltransferase [Firmicutes bacterium]|nr:nicotinate (nicotinamide) nucleotide adenylyltransferase [Bacillota bacterium]
MTRIGLFGGSFDPPHAGHLLLAESAREELHLEKVYFIPARQSPLKDWSAFASPEERLAMVGLAVADNPFFEVCRVELEREPPSYTVETVKYFHRLFPEAELWLILGEDNLAELHRWYHVDELLALTRVGVGKRPGNCVHGGGEEKRFPVLAGGEERIRFFSHPGIELSSQEIRERIQAGRSIRYRVPEKVREYIERRRLYGG